MSLPLRRVSTLILATGLVGLGLAEQGHAKERSETELAEAAALEAATNALAPTVRWLGFADRSDDQECDPVEAAYGRCVELVDFLDMSAAWDEGSVPDKATRMLREDISHLSAQLWEGMAYRWNDKEDVVQETLGAAGLFYLPTPGSIWESSARGQRWLYTLPEPSQWMRPTRWLQEGPLPANLEELPDGTIIGAPIYRDIRYHRPSGVPTPPEMALIKGRFASRLAYDGKRHAYDVMDGDPQSSGPFFEQMYPYDTARESQDPDLAPLAHFIAPATLKKPGLDPADLNVQAMRREAFKAVSFQSDEGYAAARSLALGEFQRFYHLVGTQILRFALEEYTPTHLRVLTALIAMDTPPSKLQENAGARDVVAASEGQTDDEALISGMVMPQLLSSGRSFSINYDQLPPAVVEDYVTRFDEWKNPPPDFLDAFNAAVLERLDELLRPGAAPLLALDDASLEKWIDAWSMPGRAPDVSRFIKRVGLETLVDRLPEDMKDEVLTRLLLDHVELDVSGRFDPSEGFRATPADQETQTANQWKSVLARHGFYPSAIPDGPGAVDPIAICTTRDRIEALSEPSFGAVDLDVVVSAKDGLKGAEAVLWSARDSVPFILVDDPSTSKPSVERLVGLPAGQALYRVRWRVWSGWHILWGTESLGEDSGKRRLVMRTAAVCEDTVITPPELVPTLVRAALLDGDFRGTVPVTGLSRKERKEIEARERLGRGQLPEEGVTSDEAVVAGATAEDAGEEVYSSGERTVDLSSDDPERADEISLTQASRLSGLVNHKDTRQRILVGEAAAPVAYLQSLVRPPLERVASTEKSVMFLLYDVNRGKRGKHLWSWRPRSPYMQEQRRVGPKDWMRVALWSQNVQMSEEVGYHTLISPAWHPTESVSAGSPTPRWRRHTHSDFQLTGALGYFPWRQVTYSCPDSESVLDDVNDPSTLALCSDGEQLSTANTDGLSFDMSSLYEFWFLDQPRIAVEVGPEIQILLLPGGTGRINSEGEPDYSAAWSLRAGAVAGLRFAPDPNPLWLRGTRTPWGANAPDGTSRLGRVQHGLRVGFLLGSGFNGFEGNVTGEYWAGWSLRRSETASATFTPYRPGAVLGPYVRGQYGMVILAGDEDRYYEMDQRFEVLLGVRAQLRLGGGQAALPEVE